MIRSETIAIIAVLYVRRILFILCEAARARGRGNGRTGNGPPPPPPNEPPFARKYRWQKFNCSSFFLCHAVPVKSHAPENRINLTILYDFSLVTVLGRGVVVIVPSPPDSRNSSEFV